MKYLAFSFVVLLSACSGKPEATVIDQCMRIELAQKCIASLPAGPTETKYNDWDEVIGQCDTNAMRQAVRYRQYVKPECAR